MISFGGIASGLDTAAIINGLVGLERQKVTRIERRRSQTEQAISDFSTLKSKIEDLRKVVDNMGDSTTFGKFNATSSDDAALTVGAEGGAAPGIYDIEVQQLAQVHKSMTNAVASKNQTGLFGTGTIDITVGTEDPIQVTVDGTTTLSSLKDAINNSGAKVNASIVNDGSGFRLIVSGEESGAANTVSFAETGTTLGMSDVGNQLSTAQDSQIVLDGALTVTGTSNSLTEVIEGVTLNLEKAEVGTQIEVQIERDADGQAEALEEFVTAYNDVMTYINDKSKASQVGDQSMLVGDSSLRSIKSQMRSVLQTAVATGGDYNTASAMGIETQTGTGLLSLDKVNLEKALDADFQGVLSVFTKDDDGLAALFDDAIENLLADDGLIDLRQDGMNRRIKDLNRRIDNQNIRLDSYEERLRAQFLAMEEIISGLNDQSAFLQGQIGIF